MAYTPLDVSKPDTSTQSMPQASASTRANFSAMRDHLVTFGSMPGWAGEAQDSDGSTPPTDATKPDQWVWSRGTERIKAVLTYGATGGSQDAVETAVFYYSSDSGSTYSLMADTDYPNAKLTITYDADSNVIAYSWS